LPSTGGCVLHPLHKQQENVYRDAVAKTQSNQTVILRRYYPA
jgi:hypothetical protein